MGLTHVNKECRSHLAYQPPTPIDRHSLLRGKKGTMDCLQKSGLTDSDCQGFYEPTLDADGEVSDCH